MTDRRLHLPTLAVLVCLLGPLPIEAQVRVVNMIPNARSNETVQDAEPNIAVNPSNPQQIAASAFTPNPTGGANAPIYVSTNGGGTWILNNIVPGNNVSYGTGDITLSFGRTSGVLYAATLRGNVPLQLNILRTNNYTSTTPMTVLVARNNDDQPYVEATTAALAPPVDRVYIGNNDISQRLTTGQTASVDQSLNAATAPAPAGFGPTRIEPRATAALPFGLGNQDGPSVRPAIHSDGTVYAAYFGWRTFGTPNVTDVVVVRDDSWGTGTPAFAAITDPGDGLAGVRVVTGVNVAPLGTLLGRQRIGSSLALTVDPRNSRTVYLAWADGATANAYTIHVRRSTDGGATWSSDLRTVVGATNPSLAVNSEGTVAFLYQQLTAGRWATHVELREDGFTSLRDDHVLANFPDNACFGACGAGPLGDYAEITSVGRTFYGVFSAWNIPDRANFPEGVVYQRNVNFTTNTLLATDNVTPVQTSVDPFFFSIAPSQGMRTALSIHGGITTPLGILNTTTDPGPAVTLDFVYPFTPQLAVDFRLGYSNFNGISGASDVDIWNLSANLKAIPLLSIPYAIVNGGFGLYYVDYNDLEAGFSVGIGLGQPINSTVDLEVTLNYHRTFTASPDLEFLRLQLGLIIAL